MNDEITWDKGRVAVLDAGDGNRIPVWLSDDGGYWRLEEVGQVLPISDLPNDTTVTPREDWKSRLRNGVWLCDCDCGYVGPLRVVGGKVRGDGGVDVSDHWTPIKYLCPIPEDWQIEKEN